MPFSIKPERGQVAEYGTQSPKSERWGVFHKDDSGSKDANAAFVFSPQSASFAVKSVPVAGGADVLAGESAADEINPPIVGWFWGEGSNIIVPSRIGPMLLQHATAKRVDFDLPLTRQAGAFKAKVETPDASEQRTKGDLHGCLILSQRRNYTLGVF